MVRLALGEDRTMTNKEFAVGAFATALALIGGKHRRRHDALREIAALAAKP